ncbi:MAG: sugar phosphate nucleotidyltransferase [Actinomycetota bacterium]|nr:sugar phosphate nucleotidyltransferase [Actinomycetota bacterium]
MPIVRPVVLSGGAGTRLWPLSTKAFPKQFADLIGDTSLFEQAMTRLDGRPGVCKPIVVTGSEHIGLVAAAANSTGLSPEFVVVEPAGRNTAPAVIAAALLAEPEEILVVLPSDHLIGDVDGFDAAVTVAAEEAVAGAIVTFGVVPTRAETGYGYIEAGDEQGQVSAVLRFKEKPEAAEAEEMVAGGRHFWNSGMFVFSAAVLLAEASRYCPEILAGVEAALAEPIGGVVRLEASFAEVEKISIDHAIMEKTDLAVVVPLDVGWDDIGSYEALWSVSPKDPDGNVTGGDVMLEDVSGSLIQATSRVVAVVGVKDLVVVETPDAVLVVPRNRSQMVRELADRAQSD